MSTKGCHTMLEALKLLKYEKPVLIAGDMHSQQYTQQLKEQASSLKVSFLGYISNKTSLLSLVKNAEYFIFHDDDNKVQTPPITRISLSFTSAGSYNLL